MIDSFLKWSKRNPEKAKDLDDFLNEALIAAAKRCESCLSRALGISFSRTAGAVPEAPERPPAEGPPINLDHTDQILEPTPLERILTDAEAAYRRPKSSARPDVVSVQKTEIQNLDEEQLAETALPETPSSPPKAESVELEVEMPSDEDITGPSIDFLEAKGPPPEDYESRGDKRAFDSDFDLMEPGPFDEELQPGEPLVLSETLDDLSEEKLPEALDQLERDFSSHGLSISPTERDLEPDLPLMEDLLGPEEPVIDREESSPDGLLIPVESSQAGPEGLEIEQPLAPKPQESDSVLVPEEVAMRSPHDESSTLEYDLEPVGPPDELPHVGPEKPEVKLQEPSSRPPPPPPPPPESDESDEERRKRARRLFFGTT